MYDSPSVTRKGQKHHNLHSHQQVFPKPAGKFTKSSTNPMLNKTYYIRRMMSTATT